MKKLIGATIISAIFATSILAGSLTGNVSQVYIKPNGDVQIKIDTRSFRTIANANPNLKSFLAMALSAQASGKNLQIWFNENQVINSMLMK